MKSAIGFRMDVSDDTRKDFLGFALSQLGKEYDYDMNTEDDTQLYCSEFLYQCLLHIGIKTDGNTNMLARTAVSPTDLVHFFHKDNLFFTFILYKEGGRADH